MVKKIAVGSDHGGFALKEMVKKTITGCGGKVEDVGTRSDEPCDYPAFGFKAAAKVAEGKASGAVIICKTGIGMAIVANKLPGVRAGVCNSTADALTARQHNDVNVLVLAASKVSGKKAGEIVKVWMRTKALKGRHARRVRQIRELEKKLSCVPRFRGDDFNEE
ncbi:MAG: RpiB/LacA/LacB family sugar-phosphate isomerase [Candidatus Omnitrophota bacterium]